MKDPPNSTDRRQSHRRSDTNRPYSDHRPSKGEGSSRRSQSHRKRSPRRAKSASMSPPSPDEECIHAPWLELLPKGKTYNGVEHRLHHEILAYLTYMEQTPNEKKAREEVTAAIRRVVHGRFRNAEVNVFGSSATGLTLPTSDIDIALSIPHISEVKQALFQLSAKFKESGLISSIFVNHRAHVPIITLTTQEEYGSIGVDIGINSSAGTQGVEVMKGYLARMPALRPLILLVKGFLRQRKLNDASKGGLGSYPLACLCIYFLQCNPSKRPQDYIDKPMETESLGFLLTDFMFYYGFTFSHRIECVSASQGKILPKPEPSDSLCVRCLINPENNVSKSIHKAEPFLRIFKESYATILQLTIVDQNMLGKIVSVNKKFLDKRALICGTTDVMQQVQVQAVRADPHPNVRPHPLPERPAPPPSGNTPRAPRTFKQNPQGHPHPLPAYRARLRP